MNPETGNSINKEGVPLLKNLDVKDAGISGKFENVSETYIERSELNRVMKAAGIRTGEANKLANELYANQGQGGIFDMSGKMKEGWQKKLYDAIQAKKSGDAGAPTDDMNKLVKAMEQATQAAKGLKGSQDSGSWTNGSGSNTGGG